MKSSLVTIAEALGILVFAVVVGLSYNSMREDGLNTGRNFFKKLEPRPGSSRENGNDPKNGTDPQNGGSTTQDPPPNGTGGNTGTPQPTPAQLVIDSGFQVCDLRLALEYLDGLADAVVFADARSHEKYDDGHIPSAYYLNHYQSERLIPDIIGAIEEAMFVVIYCDGGDCEDSILLATDLHLSHEVPLEQLFIYVGGFNEWQEKELPVASGHDRGEIPDLSEFLERVIEESESEGGDSGTGGADQGEAGSESSPQEQGSGESSQPPESVSGGDSNEPIDHGFQTMEIDDVVMYTDELADAVALLDARSRSKYKEGHIPGAYYLNHYQSEKLIEPIKDAVADKDYIIVYCDGGDCEDSILLCTDLVSTYGLDFERIYIYEGGYEEWTEAGNPIVEGPDRE